MHIEVDIFHATLCDNSKTDLTPVICIFVQNIEVCVHEREAASAQPHKGFCEQETWFQGWKGKEFATNKLTKCIMLILKCIL